jgi:hypothetical protein
MHLLRLFSAAALAVVLDGTHAAQPTPQVALVQPSASQVPANLLRISIEFAAPLEGPVLPRLALLRPNGTPVQEPFLQQELWSPSGKILTVMMHPGRVKTGLNAREEMGPILVVGDEVTLSFDGRPLKQWKVGPADVNGPVALAWKLSPVRVGSKQALIVALDGPIDGRDADDLAIADTWGRRVDGRAQLKDGESIWTFTPNVPWRAGQYKLVARGTLEDQAGNRLGGHFETSIDSAPGLAADAVIVFAASSSTRLNPSESAEGGLGVVRRRARIPPI